MLSGVICVVCKCCVRQKSHKKPCFHEQENNFQEENNGNNNINLSDK
jgi:hypothetical protein